MSDLFEPELNAAIVAVPLDRAWAETLNALLKKKRKLQKSK